MVAQARLQTPAHLRMFKTLMARPDLQQLASNPLILSMVLSYIRSSTQDQTSGPLNRWKLYQTAMSTIITRLDAKTLEARKGQAGRDSGEYMLMLQEIAFKAHCRQMKDLNSEVLRSAITEQTAALWEDVKESVARGQFAVLTFFFENDETIYRFAHLTFQEHLCSMVINRMLADEMERVKNIMTSAGGIRKMLQGSWWLTVTQFCLEGLMAEGDRGGELANRFAETMLEEVLARPSPSRTCTHLTLTAPLFPLPAPPACLSMPQHASPKGPPRSQGACTHVWPMRTRSPLTPTSDERPLRPTCPLLSRVIRR